MSDASLAGPSGAIRVEERPADTEPARSLLAAMSAELDELYADLEGSLESLPAPAGEMAPPGGAFVVLYDGPDPVACGGLRALAGQTAEIKRMYVVPERRRWGLGRLLLEELEDRAARRGYERIRLDTGPRQPRARAIYEGAGYREIPDYNGNPYAAHWFEKALRG